MTLSTDQQFQIELENVRGVNQAILEAKRARVEAVLLAKEVLIENARGKAWVENEVSVDEIIAFADKLTAHINA